MLSTLFRLIVGPARSRSRTARPSAGWHTLDPRLDPVGCRVRYRQDGAEGVLCEVFEVSGVPHARVVFAGPRTSWVGNVRAEQLEAA